MRIHAPELQHIDGKARLSARVDTDGGAGRLPDSLWFEVPEEFAGMVYTGVECFVIAMLARAMELGEDIHCLSPFSPRLAYHIRSAVQVMHAMDPDIFHLIAVHHPAGLTAEPPPPAAGVGLMFSGGVDSFFTLMRHNPGAQAIPDYTLTHAVYISEFDLYKQKDGSDRKAQAAFADLFERLGLTLVSPASNTRDFRLPRNTGPGRRWYLRTLQFELAATGLFLSGGLGKTLIASSQPFNAYGPDYGGDFEIETLMSTEWHEIVHDGIVEDRSAKTIALADWPESYDSLRVCWYEADGVQNCGRCPKCARTMTTLAAIGKLERYSTFPKPYRPQVILEHMATHRGSFYLKGIRALARANRRNDIAVRLSLVIVLSGLRGFIRGLVTRVNPRFKGF